MQTTTRRFMLKVTVAVGCLVALCVFAYWAAISIGMETWAMRKARFARAAERSRPLVIAIQRFTKDRGHPPESLQALVPRYIPSVPCTGLIGYPHFGYTRFTNTHSSLWWWDLGSRNGQPMAGLWVYVEGDPDHAILALTLDQERRVVDARVDRMPAEHLKAEFNADRWRKKDGRIEMVRSLPQYTNLIGQGTNEAINLLGLPDGQSLMRDAPWELRIDCPWGLINWDVFFYWPTGKYPPYIYGGSTELIGDWAYVHE